MLRETEARLFLFRDASLSGLGFAYPTIPLVQLSQPHLQSDDEVAAAPEGLLADVLVHSRNELIAKYAIEPGEYLLGRDASCHIFVDAEGVARHHARLTFSSFELVIEALGESSGIFIEGVQVQIPTRIRPDQEVQIGLARLSIHLREAASRQFTAELWEADAALTPVRALLEGRKYKVITTIGRGGMGVVMQARDLRIRRTVAMKVIKTAHQFSRENVLRFIDEAQLTGQLEHPNIIPVYELALDEQGESFYTMKYVKGITLDDVLRGLRNGRAPMIAKYPLGTLLTIFQKICDGVAFAHSKSVVHRDLKPENIMIGNFGEVLVMDWGLAKNLTAAARSDTGTGSRPRANVLSDLPTFETLHGEIIGTPPYISPEQTRGELGGMDCRSDIYVLGAILYTILALRPPVEGGSVAETVANILAGRIVPPSVGSPGGKEPGVLHHCPGRRVPDGLAAVAMKALQLNPQDRYQTVEDLQADVAAWQGGFATKAEDAGFGKEAWLWVIRHKTSVGVFLAAFLLFNAMLVTLIFKLSDQRNQAVANALQARVNAREARESAQLAADRLEELRSGRAVQRDAGEDLPESEPVSR